MSFGRNLFGTIAGNNGALGIPLNQDVDFIPKNAEGEVITIKGDKAVWLGLASRQMQLYAYNYCFPIASVVDRLAEYDITGTVEILRAKGKGKENYATNDWANRINALLKRPNPLQSWEQFRGQQVVYKKVFGFCPVLPLVPAGMPKYNATAMINLPPWLFSVKGTKNLAYTSKIDEIIDEYKVSLLGKTLTFKPDQLFILEDSFLQNEADDFLLPQSRLVGLDMAASNLCAAMEADNVLLRKKGPLGVWSQDPAAGKGVTGYMSMSEGDKEELQADLQRYGLNLQQYQYIVSRHAIKWSSASYNVNELGTKETIIASEKAVCHRYAFPYVLYEQTDSTFANSSEAGKSVYITNVMPGATKDMNKYAEFFEAAENDVKLVCDYSEIPALQEDKKLAAETEKTNTDTAIAQYNANIITFNEMRTKLGYDTIGAEGDKYKKDTETAKPEQPNPPVPIEGDQNLKLRQDEAQAA